MNTSLGVLLCNFYLLGEKKTTKDYRMKVIEQDGKRNALMYTNLTLLFPRQESRSSKVLYEILKELKETTHHLLS